MKAPCGRVFATCVNYILGFCQILTDYYLGFCQKMPNYLFGFRKICNFVVVKSVSYVHKQDY